MKKFKKAVNVVTKEIRKDESLREAYVANIAMAFKDEYARRLSEKGYAYMNKEDIHIVANDAAEYFIDLWCGKK